MQDDVVMEGPEVNLEDDIPVQSSEVINNNTSDSVNIFLVLRNCICKN